jgi:ribosomal protein S12 methylthiotransferase accessory factor
MLQGLLELIERDAVGIWWFNEVLRPSVALDQLKDAWVNEFVSELSAVGRDVWVVDISNDTQVPVFAAVSKHTTKVPEGILFGFGAHLDPRTAILRSLTELGQTLAIMHEIKTTGAPMRAGLKAWLETAAVERFGFLRPGEQIPLPANTDHQIDPGRGLAICRARLETLGIECLVHEQTRNDVGIPVVKMLAPGLRHYRRRLGAGRLYSVPVALGWVPRAKTEEELNPAVLSF